MQGVTAAVTPKGVRRKYALVTAAAELLCEAGSTLSVTVP